jgi:hypothetical protein
MSGMIIGLNANVIIVEIGILGQENHLKCIMD